MTMRLKKWEMAGISVVGILLLLTLFWFFSRPVPSVARDTYRDAAGTPTTSLQPLQRSYFSHVAQAPIYCTVDITTTDAAPFNNHSMDTAATVADYTYQSLLNVTGATPVPPTATASVAVRSDFYRLDNASLNYEYTIRAVPDRTINYNLGIIVYDRDRNAVYTDTDTSSNTASITFEATNTGPYYIEVFQVSAQCTGGTYTLDYPAPEPPTATATPIPPTNTPTPAPAATQPTELPPSGFDQYEPNFDFDTSTLIAPGTTYSLNFIPWGQWSNDNDFFRIWVKPGLRYTCETSDLGPGVDPNMIFYSAADTNSAVASNDDIATGNFNSRISFYSTYEGYLYILVGQGERMKPQDTANSTYKLQCEMTVPGEESTKTPPPGYTPPADKDPKTPRPTTRPPTTSPPTTEAPSEDTPTPTLTPSSADLTIKPVATPDPIDPTPTPSGFRTFRVLVYFDQNQDGMPGAGEGIPGFFVRSLSPENNEELARGYTDEQGQLSFTVPTVGTVRVVVPLLGFDRMIETDKPEVDIRISPPTLPDEIP